jgi:hypothetical protein
MGVREKQAPTFLSIGATFAGIGVCAWLLLMGESNPRKYTSHMAINHHNGYGRIYACSECHVPNGGFFLTPSCVTSSCHGELMPGKAEAEAIAHVLAYWQEREKKVEDPERVAKSYVVTHLGPDYANCATCHTEHTPAEYASKKLKIMAVLRDPSADLYASIFD